MSQPARVRIRPWEWRTDDAEPVAGLLVTAGKGGHVFVPASELRTLADRMHDHADRLEATE